jgi:hypothetical protein
MRHHDESEALTHVAHRLRSRFPHVAPSTITEMVNRCHRSYDGRPIRDFVPLLIEHDVLDTLRAVPAPRLSADAAAATEDADARSLEHI